VSSNLKRDRPGPGYYHFPRHLPRSFFEELTVEVRGAKRWENPAKAHNESFDLEVYHSANCLVLRVEQINWKRPPAWAAPWDSNPEIREADAIPAPRVSAKRKLRKAASTYIGR
jgi:phage terminase large subunit GpA-like protein